MRPYYRDEFREEGRPEFQFSSGSDLWPPALKYTIIVTVACFLIQLLFEARGYTRPLRAALALNPDLVRRGYLWQLLTYGFLHAGPLHIFFNVFALWIFGKDVNQTLGGERFLALYFLSIIAAGICSCLFAPYSPVIGASGGLFGVLWAFGMLFPRRIVLFMFIIPMPAKIAVLLFVLLAFWAGGSGTDDSIAHFAHLGGLAFGYLFVKTRRHWERYLADATSRMSTPRPEVDDGEVSLEDEVEMDRLLAKIKGEGLHSLSWREKRFLDRISQRLRDR